MRRLLQRLRGRHAQRSLARIIGGFENTTLELESVVCRMNNEIFENAKHIEDLQSRNKALRDEESRAWRLVQRIREFTR